MFYCIPGICPVAPVYCSVDDLETCRSPTQVFFTASQVAMLGAAAPERVKNMWNIGIGGSVFYPTTSRWGHMISAHYLKHLKNGDYPRSKLHTYMRKASP